jgi:hypothetical protein
MQKNSNENIMKFERYKKEKVKKCDGVQSAPTQVFP